MKVKYSKAFVKAIDKLSGKTLTSVLTMIKEVKRAKGLEEISNCTRLVGYNSIYRIRIGDYRAFFVLYVDISDDTIFFQYLVSRGAAYGKKMEEALRKKDQQD